MPDIQMTELDSGLRVITDHVPSVDSVALGVWVGVGTRDEDLVHNGVAHMVEHMLFKGTKKRSGQDIVQEIESVGGHMNAYTSREMTSYHCHLIKDHTNLALDVIADMVQHYTMPEAEVEKERQVILQEIGMCNDTPDDLIFDQYFETAYPGQALGAPILGTSDIVGSMQRSTLIDYVCRFYTPGRMVVSAAGNVDHYKLVKTVESLFDHLPPDSAQEKISAAYQGGEIRTQKDLEQSHIILGFQGLPRLDDNYYSAQALSAILGGGMSSRLFQEIRENRGLVYSIYSFHSSYRDDGVFGIYAGTGAQDLKELVPVVCEEIKKITDDITEEEVARAKAQLKSALLMARESMMTRADQQAKYMLLRDKPIDIAAITKRIDGLSVASVRRAAQSIFSSAPTLAGLGPVDHLESFDSIAQRLR